MKKAIIIIVVINFLLTSCATIISTTHKNVSITSNPPNSEVFIKGKLIGTTPINTSISRKTTSIELRQKGYETTTKKLKRGVNGTYFLNILAPYGLIIDAITGAVWNLPSNITVDMPKTAGNTEMIVNNKKNETQKTTPTTRETDAENKEMYASNVDFDNPGKFYAIIIGVSNYKDKNIPDLDSLPIKDAKSIKKVLNEKYLFEKENTLELYNPTRRDIVSAFADMSKKVTPNDNLFIFYAGHGHYEKDNDIGYWLPSDAEVNNPSNWLYNDQLVADIKKIKSLHTLLVSDACFSGSIFKTRSVNMTDASSFIKGKYQLPSRKAITSGTLKTVPNKSVFIKYLLDRLKNNEENFFSSSQLFQSLEEPVTNNSASLPQFGVIQNVGDEGGDFIFIKKQKTPEVLQPTKK